MDSYRVILQKLQNREPFKGNSLTGLLGSDGVYRVFSYNTKIAIAFPDGQRELDRQRYSVTTSKHQSLIARAWGMKPLGPNRAMPNGEMYEVISA